MNTIPIGIAMHGVTGRMGTNQHLLRSILAIIADGGVKCGGPSGATTLMPEPVLVGRSEDKLRDLAERVAPEIIGRALPWTTDLSGAVQSPTCKIVFDAASTAGRPAVLRLAAKHGKAVYCEKPTSITLDEAIDAWKTCQAAGIKHGVVQDKLFLPGIRRLAGLITDGFFGNILSVRGDFGYWVFTGHGGDQPPQRPSWNYRAQDGGGLVADMFCHWRYVLDHLFGGVNGVFASVHTDLPERLDETGTPYPCTADDSAFAIFELDNKVPCHFASSWTTRVRRDDLLTIQIDGDRGSAVAGLRDCWIQSLADTPRPVWNPDIPQPIDFNAGWTHHSASDDEPNAFRVQWEMFLRHVALDEPWEFGLLEGAKGVQLAEAGLRSSADRRWVNIDPLS